MEYRTLGRTGLKVSEIGLGAWPLGGSLMVAGHPLSYGEVSGPDAAQVLGEARRLGINFFDTADFYGLGKSEAIIGEAFGASEGVVITTKAGYLPDGQGGSAIDLSYHHLMAAAARSVKRLKRKPIDVFLLHSVPANAEAWNEARRALIDLKAEGLIRHSGISVAANFEGVQAYLEDSEVEVIEVHFNLLFRKYKGELAARVKQSGTGVIVSSPLSRGVLSDGFSEKRTYADADVRNKWFSGPGGASEMLAKREKLTEVLAPQGFSLTGTALAYLLEEETVSTVIPGMKNGVQVTENCEKLYGRPYPKELFRELERRLDEPQRTASADAGR